MRLPRVVPLLLTPLERVSHSDQQMILHMTHRSHPTNHTTGLRLHHRKCQRYERRKQGRKVVFLLRLQFSSLMLLTQQFTFCSLHQCLFLTCPDRFQNEGRSFTALWRSKKVKTVCLETCVCVCVCVFARAPSGMLVSALVCLCACSSVCVSCSGWRVPPPRRKARKQNLGKDK